MKSKAMALLSFLLIMGAIFYLTFGSLGLWLSDIMADGVHWWVARLSSILDFFAVNAVVHSLIIDGVCAGVGSVLSFLPVIAVLFFCLSIIETCGYLSYISAKMDRWLRRIGLSGFSFVPLLTGFGCSVPAIMAAGKLPSRYDKCLTIFLIPFMSCSAKLPIYTLIAPIFFAEKGILVIALLYLTGILCALLALLLLRKGFQLRLCGEQFSRLSYPLKPLRLQVPSLRQACQAVWLNVRDFSKKAFTVIFLGSIVVWFLENFDCSLALTGNPENSILAVLGRTLVPFFAPLGITDWRLVSALIAGLSAKEAVVSTLAVMASSPVGSPAFQLFLEQIFTPFTACVFMTFCLFYVPCIASLATVRKELGGWRYSFIMLSFQLLFAWIISFLLCHFGLLLS